MRADLTTFTNMSGWKQNPELSMTLYYILTQPKAYNCGKSRVEEGQKKKIKWKTADTVNSALIQPSEGRKPSSTAMQIIAAIPRFSAALLSIN